MDPQPSDIEKDMVININPEIEIELESIDDEECEFESFSCYLVQSLFESSETPFWQRMLRKFFVWLNEVELKRAFSELLLYASTMELARMNSFFDIIKQFVTNEILPARIVCECILNCDEVVYHRKEFWILCFEVILSHLPSNDFEAVRKIMKGCCKKASSLPYEVDSRCMPQVTVIFRVFNVLFHHENNLLPPYFVDPEIKKALLENELWPHWTLSDLMVDWIKSFRRAGQMVSIIGHDTKLPIVENSINNYHFITPWKLDQVTLKFSQIDDVCCDNSLLKSQSGILRYVLMQPNSEVMVSLMLGLEKKTICRAIENQLVKIIVKAMKRTQPDSPDNTDLTHFIWLHLTNQLLYFVVLQFAEFPNIVNGLLAKVCNLSQFHLKKGRDHLMWLMMQFISGSIQYRCLDYYLPVVKLYDLLYPETDPSPVPELDNWLCTHQMAATSLWIHLLHKARIENFDLQRNLPDRLKLQYEFLQMHLVPDFNLILKGDYKIALICNAFSSNRKFKSSIIAVLTLAMRSPQTSILDNSSLSINTVFKTIITAPLNMDLLDALTSHVKMGLNNFLIRFIVETAHSKLNTVFHPAVFETLSRLSVYMENKMFTMRAINVVFLPLLFKLQDWCALGAVLEMINYRMYHLPSKFALRVISYLHGMISTLQLDYDQLWLRYCIESTIIHLVNGIGCRGVPMRECGVLYESLTAIVSQEWEELNRILVLNLARWLHSTGIGTNIVDKRFESWSKELLDTIYKKTPHYWPSHTLHFFPAFLNSYYQRFPARVQNHEVLFEFVELEYVKWTLMIEGGTDVVKYYSTLRSPVFLCVVWNVIFETSQVCPAIYEVLKRTGANVASAHLDKLCDYLVSKILSSNRNTQMDQYIDTTKCMIWKYNFFTLDKFVLCMVLRPFEGERAEAALSIIGLLLLENQDFMSRIRSFVNEHSRAHWKQSNWLENHLEFHRKFPEMLPSEDASRSQRAYFGNICLRFLPILDLIIHRHLEVPSTSHSLELMLKHFGCLYKFHDRPVTFLYHTFYYYESILLEKPALKRLMVNYILISHYEFRFPEWSLSIEYLNHMTSDENEVPELSYFVDLIQRLVDTISGKTLFWKTDWRFDEFPNQTVYAVYMTCTEIMALWGPIKDVANHLLNVVIIRYPVMQSHLVQPYANAIGMVMSALPNSYWWVLHDRIVETIVSTELLEWDFNYSPFEMFTLKNADNTGLKNLFVHVLAVAHSAWHQARPEQISVIPTFARERLISLIRTEEQFLFLCHLIGPFLLKFKEVAEEACFLNLTTALFRALVQINSVDKEFVYGDPICDFLYYIKDRFLGDQMNNEAEDFIRQLRPQMQRKLRFFVLPNPKP